MTADEFLRRDARIAQLEARGDDRTADEQDELLHLEVCRIAAWKRLADRVLHQRRKYADLEAYARQIGLPLEPVAA